MAKIKSAWYGLILLFLLLPLGVAHGYLPGPTEDQSELFDLTPLLQYETSLIDDPQVYLPHDLPYARVVYAAPIYHTLSDAAADRPFTVYGSGSRWAVVHRQAYADGQPYYRISWGWAAAGWVAADALSFSPSLSRLRGIDMTERSSDHKLAMVHHAALHVRAEPGVITDDNILGTLPRYSLITVHEERVVDGARWYRLGPAQWGDLWGEEWAGQWVEQWVNSFYVRDFRPSSRPAAVGPDEKWIEINLRQQTVIAHEGDRPVFATLTSTGRPDYETEPGLFRIWIKNETAPMTWTDAEPPYSLASVPWIAYFNKGQGLHGVYWHDNYGTVRSAGCVNLSPHDAHWLFHWADPPMPEDQRRDVRPTADTPGTWVWVH